MGSFVFVIYDTETFEVWFASTSEKVCIQEYKEKFEGFKNIDWKAINIKAFFNQR